MQLDQARIQRVHDMLVSERDQDPDNDVLLDATTEAVMMLLEALLDACQGGK
jgi:hypothetical protein